MRRRSAVVGEAGAIIIPLIVAIRLSASSVTTLTSSVCVTLHPPAPSAAATAPYSQEHESYLRLRGTASCQVRALFICDAITAADDRCSVVLAPGRRASENKSAGQRPPAPGR